MPDTTQIQGLDAIAMMVVAVILAVFGILVGFQLGCQIARNTKTKEEYLQKSAIAYGFAILFTAVVCMTGYVILSVLMFGAIGGLIAGLTMEYGKMVGPFKVAHDFAGRKRQKSQDSVKKDVANKCDMTNQKNVKANPEGSKTKPKNCAAKPIAPKK